MAINHTYRVNTFVCKECGTETKSRSRSIFCSNVCRYKHGKRYKSISVRKYFTQTDLIHIRTLAQLERATRLVPECNVNLLLEKIEICLGDTHND